MAKIIHIEDDPQFRENVRQSLLGIEGLELKQAVDFGDFQKKVSFDTDLYITDRHFPYNSGMPVSDLWSSVVGYASEMRNIYPSKGVIILSDHPPAPSEWTRYHKLILSVQKKSDFNSDSFRQLVRSFLEV